MTITEREELRLYCNEEIARLAGSDMPPTLAAWCLRLLDALDEVEHSYKSHLNEVEQTLGKALGYPRYKNDPENFPDGAVCVGEHVPESLADEIVNKWREAERKLVEFHSTFEESIEYIGHDAGGNMHVHTGGPDGRCYTKIMPFGSKSS